MREQGDKSANKLRGKKVLDQYPVFKYCVRRLIHIMAEGHIHSPGYKTLEHVVMLADKLNEARGRHSG